MKWNDVFFVEFCVEFLGEKQLKSFMTGSYVKQAGQKTSKYFRVGVYPTLLQDLCSTGKKELALNVKGKEEEGI